MWYYLWRVNNGLHSSINYDFLLPGHTKFAPDWCFGLVKQKTRRTFISSLFDIARAVEESASVNVAEFVGLHNGTVRVPTFDWATSLGQFYKKLPNIKSYFHSRFDKEFPGTAGWNYACAGAWPLSRKDVIAENKMAPLLQYFVLMAIIESIEGRKDVFKCSVCGKNLSNLKAERRKFRAVSDDLFACFDPLEGESPHEPGKKFLCGTCRRALADFTGKT